MTKPAHSGWPTSKGCETDMADHDADLAYALQAHHDSVVHHAATLGALAERGRVAQHPDPYRLLREISEATARVANELALGLEGLQRLIDSAKTVRLPFSEIARANMEDK